MGLPAQIPEGARPRAQHEFVERHVPTREARRLRASGREGALHLALRVAVGDRAPLVEALLATGDGQLDLTFPSLKYRRVGTSASPFSRTLP